MNCVLKFPNVKQKPVARKLIFPKDASVGDQVDVRSKNGTEKANVIDITGNFLILLLCALIIYLFLNCRKYVKLTYKLFVK